MEHPLIVASQNGHLEVVRTLLDGGSDPNIQDEDGFTALIFASQNGHLEVVKTLLDQDRGVNPNIQTKKDGYTALIFASQNGHLEVVKTLLDHRGVDPNIQSKNYTALISASIKGYSEIIKTLLDRGADPNIQQQNNGFTALIFASHNGHSEVVKTLLDRGADLNTKNKGYTALMIASYNGHLECVKTLLDRGSDPNIKNDVGSTALIIASQNGHSEVVKTLIDRGADPNIKNDIGYTALMIASSKGYLEIVKTLFDGGADPNIKDKNGNTAVKFAVSKGHSEIVKFFKIQELLDLSSGHSDLRLAYWNKKEALESSIGCFDVDEGTLCDVNDQEDYNNQKYLDGDSGNLIFMLPYKEGGFKAYGTNISGIVYDKNTDIFLNCVPAENNIGQGTFNYTSLGGQTRRYNLDLKDLYVILKFEYQIYVPLLNLIGALQSKQRVFLVKPTGIKFNTTVSYGIAFGFKNNLPYNLISGDHCQEGTEKTISELYVCFGGENC